MTSTMDFWQRSLDWMESAKREASFNPDSSASCCYYSVFYALSALFAVEGKLFNSHDGIEIALHRDFIKAEILPASVGMDLRKLRQFRRIGNYG